MKRLLLSCLVCFGLTCLVGAGEPNTLTPREKAEGWTLLFDGKTGSAWRGFGKDTFPKQGWVIRDGWLVKQQNVSGGNLISRKTYKQFELSWEWKMSPRGNNGIKYFVIEKRGAIGHEYQMLDDPGRTGKGSTASFYDVLAPTGKKSLKPAGQVNQARIVARDAKVQHWLNGSLVLEYACGSDAVKAAIANSKFRKVAGFGEQIDGHIVLTDHKDECAFRNLKIREFDR